MDIVSLIISLVSGAAGGNIVGALVKKISLGVLGNSLAGILGGGIGSQILGGLLGGGGGAAAGSGMLGNVLGSGIGDRRRRVDGSYRHHQKHADETLAKFSATKIKAAKPAAFIIYASSQTPYGYWLPGHMSSSSASLLARSAYIIPRLFHMPELGMGLADTKPQRIFSIQHRVG